MTSEDHFRHVEDQLRRAVETGAYEQALQILPGFCGEAAAQGPLAAQRTKGTLEWARRAVLASRARIEAQLAAVALPPYPYQRPTAHASTFSVEG